MPNPKKIRNAQADNYTRVAGLAIRFHRTRLNMTQGELAKRTGFSRTQITNLESGRTDTSITTLSNIANTLGLTLLDLLQPIDEATVPNKKEQRGRPSRYRGLVQCPACGKHIEPNMLLCSNCGEEMSL